MVHYILYVPYSRLIIWEMSLWDRSSPQRNSGWWCSNVVDNMYDLLSVLLEKYCNCQKLRKGRGRHFYRNNCIYYFNFLNLQLGMRRSSGFHSRFLSSFEWKHTHVLHFLIDFIVVDFILYFCQNETLLSESVFTCGLK